MEAVRGCAGVYSRPSAKIANFDYQTQEVEIGRMEAPWSRWGSLTALGLTDRTAPPGPREPPGSSTGVRGGAWTTRHLAIYIYICRFDASSRRHMKSRPNNCGVWMMRVSIHRTTTTPPGASRTPIPPDPASETRDGQFRQTFCLCAQASEDTRKDEFGWNHCHWHGSGRSASSQVSSTL